MSTEDVAFLTTKGPYRHLVSVKFSDPPHRNVVKLAEFAVRVAHSLHRGVGFPHDPPVLRWFKWSGPTVGVTPRKRSGGYWIALAKRLRGRELVRAALHESRHCFQHGVKEYDDDRPSEADADAFAGKWGPVVMKAWDRCRGELSRVSVVKSSFPTGWAKAGDLRIAASSARLFTYSRVHGWTRVRT